MRLFQPHDIIHEKRHRFLQGHTSTMILDLAYISPGILIPPVSALIFSSERDWAFSIAS